MDRAEKHLGDLETEAEACIQRQRDAITQELDTERGLYVYNLGPGNRPEYDLGVLIGEFAHSVRAALNHLAYTIAPGDWVDFPIHDDPKKCSKALREAFPQHCHKELRRWQPYNRGDAKYDHPLWIIHRLDIVEKHLCVPVPPFNIFTGRPTLRGYNAKRETILAMPVLPGLPEPNLYPEISISISLDPFPSATKLIPITALRDAYNFVRDKVVPSVEKLIPYGPHL